VRIADVTMLSVDAGRQFESHFGFPYPWKLGKNFISDDLSSDFAV
jgi:hypothetical protein